MGRWTAVEAHSHRSTGTCLFSRITTHIPVCIPAQDGCMSLNADRLLWVRTEVQTGMCVKICAAISLSLIWKGWLHRPDPPREMNLTLCLGVQIPPHVWMRLQLHGKFLCCTVFLFFVSDAFNFIIINDNILFFYSCVAELVLGNKILLCMIWEFRN